MTETETLFEEFSAKYQHLEAEELIAAAYDFFDEGKLASFSSFGSFSALLLDMVAKADKNIPIVFLETGKHFPETLEFVETVKDQLGLQNIKALTPSEQILNNADPSGELWQNNVDRCCWIRKVEPLDRHMEEANYHAVITGRRAYQTKEREGMKSIEMDDKGKIRINPIAFWSKDKIEQEFNERGLSQHPLVAKGYPSIGCAPCTNAVKPGEDERSGRWAHTAENQAEGEQKVECGIHLTKEETKDWEAKS